MNFRKIMVALAFLTSLPAHAVDCPSCSPEELYKENMKLMKTMAIDMKALDDSLKGLSPISIATLEKMMAAVGGDGVAQQTMAIAIGNKKRVDQAVSDAAEIARLAGEAKVVQLKIEELEAESKILDRQKDQDPLSLRSQNNALREDAAKSSEAAKEREGAAVPTKGLFVTFVKDNEVSTKRAVIISLDGRAISLKTGSQFSYSNEQYELVSVEPALSRRDNRKWNVYFKKGDEKGLHLLDWAN